VGRYTIGRRRFSWERRGRHAVPGNSPADPFGALIVVLPLTYFLVRPVFWILISCLTLLIACVGMMWSIQLRERVKRRRRVRSSTD
jgi:hypothetical protein